MIGERASDFILEDAALMLEMALDFGKIVIADIVLSGDNALIIGMAAAGLAPELRKKGDHVRHDRGSAAAYRVRDRGN